MSGYCSDCGNVICVCKVEDDIQFKSIQDLIKELKEEIEALNAKIKERDELIKTGLLYMQEAHNKFTPNVTNSLALDWIEKAKQLTEEK